MLNSIFNLYTASGMQKSTTTAGASYSSKSNSTSLFGEDLLEESMSQMNFQDGSEQGNSLANIMGAIIGFGAMLLNSLAKAIGEQSANPEIQEGMADYSMPETVQGNDNPFVYSDETAESADIDGEIDSTQQGELADCWLLSGVNSLNASESGQDVIKNAIKNNGDGTYTIDLDGAGKSYTINDNDIANAKATGKYSSGDDDMLAFELAVEQCRYDALTNTDPNSKLAGYQNYLQSIGIDNQSDLLSNGSASELYQILGLQSEILNENKCSNPQNYEENVQEAMEILEENPEDYAMTAIMDTDNGKYVEDKDGNQVEILANEDEYHEWSIEYAKNGIVGAVNPWDSEEIIEFTTEQFAQYTHDIGIAEIP